MTNRTGTAAPMMGTITDPTERAVSIRTALADTTVGIADAFYLPIIDEIIINVMLCPHNIFAATLLGMLGSLEPMFNNSKKEAVKS